MQTSCSNFLKGNSRNERQLYEGFRIEQNIVLLYNSKKLRNLVNCLDHLENCVLYSEIFLKECSRKWKFLALEISAPFCSPETITQSKFDLLIGELSWNLGKIRYALYLPREKSSMVEWKWCSRQCRQVLRGAGGSVDHEGGGGSRANMDDDRVNLKFLLENGFNLVQDESYTTSLWRLFLIEDRIYFSVSWIILGLIACPFMQKEHTIGLLGLPMHVTYMLFVLVKIIRFGPWMYIKRVLILKEWARKIMQMQNWILKEWAFLQSVLNSVFVAYSLSVVHSTFPSFQFIFWILYILVPILFLREERMLSRIEDRARKYFRAILEQRLGTQNMSISTSNSSSISVLTAFRIGLSYLKFDTEIGGGGYKRIYRGEWVGLKVAIAIINVAHLDSGQSLVENEARHLAELKHPNIVAFYGYGYTCRPILPTSYCRIDESPPEAVCYLVMELMEEDLSRTIENCMKSVGPFSMPVAIDILLQIVEAMVYLHERGIMHRDLKPMNCLVKARCPPLSSSQDVYYDIKLTDFGSSKEMVVLDNTPNPGTTSWMAPEMLGTSSAGRIPYTKSGDVYSFGMIGYQVITMDGTPKLPKRFPSYPRDALIEAVRNGARPEFPPSLSCPEGLKNLITDCWAGRPDARPNFKAIRERLWDLKRVVEVGEI